MTLLGKLGKHIAHIIIRCCQSAVTKTLKRYAETKCNESRPGRGRKSTITPSDRRYIELLSTQNGWKTVPQLTAEFNTGCKCAVSKITSRRMLTRCGLRGCVAVNKPLLRLVNVRKRCKFAKKILKMKKKKSLKIFFTDETKIDLFGDKKNGYCCRRPGERFDRRCVKATVKHGGESIMCWGWISAVGKSKLRRIYGTFLCTTYSWYLQKGSFGCVCTSD